MKVLITGGFSTLGRAIAKEFYSKGWDVYITAREYKPSDCFKVIEMDVTDGESIEKALSSLDSLDVLVNNAGIFTEGYQDELSDELFDKVFDVNVKGLFRVTKKLLPLLKASNGSIVNIASINALHPGFGKTAHYDASKGAVKSYTASLAAETGLRVNAVAPGLIMADRLKGSELESFYSSHSVERSMVRSEDIASAVYFLAISKGIYGQTLTVDNGYLLF